MAQLEKLDRDPKGYLDAFRKSAEHLNFVMQSFKWQSKQSRYFIFEQPIPNSNWDYAVVSDMSNRDDVFITESTERTFGQFAYDDCGRVVAAHRRTGFMSNCKGIRKALIADGLLDISEFCVTVREHCSPETAGYDGL